MSRFEAEVRARAGEPCEYCLLPQVAFKRSFHVEHIISRQHGGRTDLENLAFACWFRNLKKGPNLSGVDPENGAVASLFNPRQQRWPEHFVARIAAQDAHAGGGVWIIGRTPSGRATVNVLDMNDPFRCEIRAALADEGLYDVPTE